MAWSKAKPIIIDGIEFGSIVEGRDYQALKLLLAAGDISDLKLQPRFRLEVNGELIGHYKADFMYTEKHGATVVYERKGRVSRDFPLRWKLCQALYPQYKYVLKK